LGVIKGNVIKEEYKYVFSLGLVLLLILYYGFRGRYKRIIQKYDDKERLRGKGLHPILVIIIYYGISVALLFLAGFYKHRVWIFK
jgi:type VI protein secretion system component VasF